MRIVILTNAYPYLPGEQFIEDEIEYWANIPAVSVTLLPAVAAGEPRHIPEGVSIDPGMTGGTRIERLWFALIALFSAILRNELSYLRQSQKMGMSTATRALLHTSKVLEQAKRLQQYARTHGEIDVAYCYWNETLSYAAVLAKAKGSIRKVVSRTHGFDLYEMRRPHGYMPLKRQFIHAYDRIFSLSQKARTYLEETYGAPPGKVQVSPLGVPLAGGLSRSSPPGFLHVVSVSFCLPVKRLDRIIDALSLFARGRDEIRTTWTHIGDGPLLEEIKELATARLADRDNISFEFIGEMPNRAIKDYYLGTPVDVFVNTSESEGMPVSIMEAMSAGVPAIAPDVGGVSSLVSDECGALLNQGPNSREIADAIGRVALGDDRITLRMNARKVIEARFSASRNYTDFVSDVLAIGATQG